MTQNLLRPGSSTLDACTTRHPRTQSVSESASIEEAFDWIKTVGDLRQRYRRRARVQIRAYLVGAAYKVLGIARLAQVFA